MECWSNGVVGGKCFNPSLQYSITPTKLFKAGFQIAKFGEHFSMILEVVKYGDPVLRAKGARIETITPAIEHLIEDMFETMYHARGIGLAAQQVGHALQLTVIDVREAVDRPSTLELNGKPAEPNDFM